MRQRILVSQECQTAGIARTLQSVFADASVDAKILHELPADDDEAAREIARYDVWVTAGRNELCDNRSTILIQCPRFNFISFHPDITYARNESTSEVAYVASSRIVSWAFSQRLSIDAAASMFNADVFQALGYFDRWEAEIKNLRDYYTAGYGLDFDAFYMDIKREGIFMHDIAHPTAGGLAKFGKMLARKMGATRQQLSQRVTIPDTFGGLTWPVYPEIAENLGLSGSYIWGETVATGGGLQGYIAYAYARFEASGFEPGRVGVMSGDGFENIETLCDPILLPFVRSR